MKIKPIYLLVFHFIFSHYCFSQETFLPSLNPDKKIHQYVHDSWKIENGLPSDTVWVITQTLDGYLWLGIYNGLVRFDGVRFTVFNRDNTKT